MLAIVRKTIPAVALFFVSTCALAQRNAHFVSGHFSEKSLAELRLVQVVNNKLRPIAEYRISPDNRNFVFVIPGDTGVTYRLHVNIMKQEGRHAKVDKAFTLLLPLNPEQNYTLKITPSKLNEAKKAGWELKNNRAKSPVAFVSGRVTGFAIKSGMQLSLQTVENGSLVFHSSVQSNNDGSFEIACPVTQEGFYYLTTMRWRARLYLKPGDRIQTEVDHKTGNFTSLNGSAENEILFQWQQLISPITSYGYNLYVHSRDSFHIDDYIRTYQGLSPAMADFARKTIQSNPPFMKDFRNAVDIDSQLAPINFLLYHPVKKQKGFNAYNKEFNEVPEFYRQFIRPGKFTDASILRVGEAREFMNHYVKLNMALFVSEESRNLSQAEKLKRMLNAISNDTLKSLFLNDQMLQLEINNLSEFREIVQPFQKYAKTAPAKNTYQGIYKSFIGDTAYIGKSAYNFSLPDTNGRMVSMKDFKGKVVFIDVWATWCGPCKAQFPFLKEIEEEYRDNPNIVFAGISIDRAKDHDKWIKMIRKENLVGLQLLDDTGKAFAKPYDISAIPRFMLIDKQGRWIEIRCPLPEAKENLKRYLDKALAENKMTKK